MKFTINHDLLTRTRAVFSGRHNLFWVVGGAGSGKSTVCRALSSLFSLPVYDMDAHVYGSYHTRFTAERHPVNTQWSAAADGMAWLLGLSWEEFDSFNQAALVEYLDLLGEDISDQEHAGPLLIDGGVCNPRLVAEVIPPDQIVCLSAPGGSSRAIWESDADRLAMKEMILHLPDGEEAWEKFLEFDRQITLTMVRESEGSNIGICERGVDDTVDDFAGRVARVLGIAAGSTGIDESDRNS